MNRARCAKSSLIEPATLRSVSPVRLMILDEGQALVWILAKPRIFLRMSPIYVPGWRLTPVPPQ